MTTIDDKMQNMGGVNNLDNMFQSTKTTPMSSDPFSKKNDFRPMSGKIDALKNKSDYELRPKITVFGVGGAGGNAVNNMIATNVEGCDFVIANTDAQAIAQSIADKRIQLGITITRGLGAGSRPDVGRAAAEEAKEEIQEYLYGSNMVFITAGMGGGTGTGAAPVIAKLAKEQGILTIGVVTKPFHFEGTHRMRLAEKGITELQKFVDTLLIIPNQNLFRIANEKTTFADAFKMADNVLSAGVRGVTDLMVMPGLINLDFADIRSVMSEMGKAMMGTGDAEGENKAIMAAEAAISNPLLDDVSMKGAKGVLINITGGYDMTLYEVDEAANRIRDEVDPDANIIFGSTFDANLEGHMRVSVVATGIDSANDKSSSRTAQIRQLLGQDDDQDIVSNSQVVGSDVSMASREFSSNYRDTYANEDQLNGFSNGSSDLQQGNTQSVRDGLHLVENDTKSDEQFSEDSRQVFPPVIEKKKTFFGRLSSLISGNKKQASTSSRNNDKSGVDSDISGYTQKKEQQKRDEEDLDIPAFLRRK